MRRRVNELALAGFFGIAAMSWGISAQWLPAVFAAIDADPVSIADEQPRSRDNPDSLMAQVVAQAAMPPARGVVEEDPFASGSAARLASLDHELLSGMRETLARMR